MAQAQNRWQEAVAVGAVRNVTARKAADLLKEGWTLLDVRPPKEVAKGKVEGSVDVPLFIEDPATDLAALMKKASAFGMGGWWLGGTHMVANEDFGSTVGAAIPRDAKVIVACQKGLRSLAACEQLSKAGYAEVAWLNGGYDTALPGELPTVGGVDIRYAGLGGVSEMVGWNDVQQEAARQQMIKEGKLKEGEKGDGLTDVTKIAAAVLLLDGVWTAWTVFSTDGGEELMRRMSGN